MTKIPGHWGQTAWQSRHAGFVNFHSHHTRQARKIQEETQTPPHPKQLRTSIHVASQTPPNCNN